MREKLKDWSIPKYNQYLKEWDQELELVLQNDLLDESKFITFSKERGIDVAGVVSGDPGNFHARGWLREDGTSIDSRPLFHPFRIYPLHKILQECKLNIQASASLHREQYKMLVDQVIESLLSIEQIGKIAEQSNQIADLLILLEPVFWPKITGRLRWKSRIGEKDHMDRLDQYRPKVMDVVRTLDPNMWKEIHQLIRFEAAWIDGNSDLYLLLRLSKWEQRKRLKGHISGSLWFRHMAEVLRRAFEEEFAEKWVEEDQDFGMWRPGGRKMLFGSERPLDEEIKSKPYLAFNFGLFTGSAVRWYVEGDTEYYAVLYVVPEPSLIGIELVNLRGHIETGRNNVALKLQDWLLEDKALRRFSIISFDTDVAANVKAIRIQLEQQNIVGMIAAHKPDFEFDNFTLEELIEIAARVDEAQGFSGNAVRNTDFTGVINGRSFEKKYMEVSEKKPSGLKGKEWGEALAAYTGEYPNRSDNGNERPFWKEIQAAMQARTANYDYQKEHFGFDPNTFEQKRNT